MLRQQLPFSRGMLEEGRRPRSPKVPQRAEEEPLRVMPQDLCQWRGLHLLPIMAMWSAGRSRHASLGPRAVPVEAWVVEARPRPRRRGRWWWSLLRKSVAT